MQSNDYSEAKPGYPPTWFLTALRYALAVVLVGTALLWSSLLHPVLANSFLVLFLLAVMAAGWFGREGPGLFAALLSALAVDYFFFPPFRTFRIDLEAIPYFLSFVFGAIAASWLSAAGRKAEEQQQAHWDELFEQAPEGIMLLDLQGRVTRVNKEFSRMFGYSREQAAGRQEMDLIVPSELQEQARQSGELLARGEMVNLETVRKHRNGALLSVSELGVPIFVSGRRIADYLIFRDISERKRAAEALAQAQAELAHLSRVTTMGELAASIAHEVNQPIAGIASSASAAMRWLAQQPPVAEEALEALRNIVEDANRAAAVIRRIRAFLEKNPAALGCTDLNEVINSVLFLTERELRSASVAVRTDLTASLPPILSDRVQLQQVLVNLILNGIEAMSGIAGARELMIRSSANSEGVLVQIRDSGPGLDSEKAARIFDPFFTTKPQGLGMGLSISRSIIEAHGGKLWIASRQPPGAEFCFSLPRMDGPE